jgi:hypothetical protein
MSWIMKWATRSNEAALCNAREAATLLSALRVEREDVALYLAEQARRRSAARSA